MFSHIIKTDSDTSGFHVHFKEQSDCFALIRKKKTLSFVSDAETVLEAMSGIPFYQIKFTVTYWEPKINF